MAAPYKNHMRLVRMHEHALVHVWWATAEGTCKWNLGRRIQLALCIFHSLNHTSPLSKFTKTQPLCKLMAVKWTQPSTPTPQAFTKTRVCYSCLGHVDCIDVSCSGSYWIVSHPVIIIWMGYSWRCIAWVGTNSSWKATYIWRTYDSPATLFTRMNVESEHHIRAIESLSISNRTMSLRGRR